MKILVAKVLLLLLGISMEIELCAAKSDTCSATTQHKCRKEGGLCQPKDKECAGQRRKGRKFCKDSKTCDCCALCSKGTKLPCKDLNGTCINHDDPCNGYVIKNKAFCKQGRLCKCCIPACACPDQGTCIYKNIDGLCSRLGLPETINVGPQECTNGCECYIPDIIPVTTQLTTLDPKHPPTTSSAACPKSDWHDSCDVYEGRCQPSTEECVGEWKTGWGYCGNQQECGCCIRTVCVWNSKEYVNGEETDDMCLILRCNKMGRWEVTGERNPKCGVCQVYGDPHFRTFDPHTWSNGPTIGAYYYQGTGDYYITRHDPLHSFGVDSHFDTCLDPSYQVSCIKNVSYFQPGGRVDMHINSGGIMVTGGSGLHIFHSSGSNSVDGQVDNHSCVTVLGSEGLSLMFCLVNNIYAYLYVWAMPFLRSSLYGLCDTYNGTERNCYTHKDGSCPKNPGDWDLKKRNQEICDFAESWRHGEGRPCSSPIPGSPCDANPTLKDDISNECNGVIPVTHPDYISLRASCVFDLCRINDTESEHGYLKGYEHQANFN